MDGWQQQPATRSTTAQSHGYYARIHQTIFRGTECSALVVKSNFATMPRRNREHV